MCVYDIYFYILQPACVKLRNAPINKYAVSTLKLGKPLKKNIPRGIIRFAEILKSVNCACSMNASVVTENVQSPCTHVTRTTYKCICVYVVNALLYFPRYDTISSKFQNRATCIAVSSSGATFYKSRLSFISFQRRIYISFSNRRQGSGWHLVLYHTVTTSSS